jgi:hypothetical protein
MKIRSKVEDWDPVREASGSMGNTVDRIYRRLFPCDGRKYGLQVTVKSTVGAVVGSSDGGGRSENAAEGLGF